MQPVLVGLEPISGSVLDGTNEQIDMSDGTRQMAYTDTGQTQTLAQPSQHGRGSSPCYTPRLYISPGPILAAAVLTLQAAIIGSSGRQNCPMFDAGYACDHPPFFPSNAGRTLQFFLFFSFFSPPARAFFLLREVGDRADGAGDAYESERARERKGERERERERELMIHPAIYISVDRTAWHRRKLDRRSLLLSPCRRWHCLSGCRK
ncbi:hypothetical protein BD289DRAFT_288843 [Coniella lustricola]|uniref:Uncharacterized protein n=1 Tax=Coniella lustricola TaxID=2025994 RepID=A0A2T3A5K4_9PEZI|nr:hypothetical protein BD289DRAFT_288843 [Coniella lustricola]